MKKYAVLFLFVSSLVFAQTGTGWKPASGGGGMTVGGSIAGGVDTRVLFDDANTLGEDSKLTFIKATGTLFTTILSDNSADPADSGFLRVGNNVVALAAEANPTGTDGTITFDTTNIWRFAPNIGTAASSMSMFVGSTAYTNWGYGNSFNLGATIPIKWNNGTIGTVLDVQMGRDAAAGAVYMADTASATPAAYSLRIGSSSRPATDNNVAGANGTITSGNGTGSSTGSSLIFQTPATTGAGSGAQTQTTRLTISEAGGLAMGTGMFLSSGADPADAGAIRLSNGDCIESEASPAGTDMTLCSNTSEAWVSNSPVLFPDGTKAAPAMAFSGEVGNGWYRRANLIMAWAVAGVEAFVLDPNSATIQTRSDYNFAWNNSTDTSGGAVDLKIGRQAAGQLRIINGVATVGDTMTQYTGTKTLTNDSATIFNKITMTSGSRTGGVIRYSVEDATTQGVISGQVPFSAVDVAGTITCAIKASDTDQQSVGGSAGFALNTGFTCADATGNILNLLVQAKTTGGTDTLNIRYTIYLNDTKTMVGQ